MTTYTITEAQRHQLLDAVTASELDDVREVEEKMLQSLAPMAAPCTSPLNDEIMWKLWNAQGVDEMNQPEAIAFVRAVEAAHGIALPPPAK